MPEKTYTLKLTLSNLKVISAALHELPYRMVADLLVDMQAQTNRQDASYAEAAKAEAAMTEAAMTEVAEAMTEKRPEDISQ